MLTNIFMEGANHSFKLLLHNPESNYALCTALYPAILKILYKYQLNILISYCKTIVKSKNLIKNWPGWRLATQLVFFKWAKTKCRKHASKSSKLKTNVMKINQLIMLIFKPTHDGQVIVCPKSNSLMLVEKIILENI